MISLQKFNSIIEKSRKDAEKAEENIPEIERLIELANKKSDKATENLGDAQKLSSEAKDKANEAKTTAQDAQKVRFGFFKRIFFDSLFSYLCHSCLSFFWQDK